MNWSCISLSKIHVSVETSHTAAALFAAILKHKLSLLVQSSHYVCCIYVWIMAISRLDLSAVGPGTHMGLGLNNCVLLLALLGTVKLLMHRQIGNLYRYTRICKQFLFK